MGPRWRRARWRRARATGFASLLDEGVPSPLFLFSTDHSRVRAEARSTPGLLLPRARHWCRAQGPPSLCRPDEWQREIPMRTIRILTISIWGMTASAAAAIGCSPDPDTKTSATEAALTAAVCDVPEWSENTAYTVGSLVRRGGSTYQCRQSHTSLADWTPEAVPALWLPTGSDGCS